MVINTSLYRSLEGVDEDSCLSPFSSLFARAARVPLQSVWGPSFSAAALQRAVTIRGDWALAGAPKLAADCLVCPQWASHLTTRGDLGKTAAVVSLARIRKHRAHVFISQRFLSIWSIYMWHFLRTLWQFLNGFICKILLEFAWRSFRTSLSTSRVCVAQTPRQVYTTLQCVCTVNRERPWTRRARSSWRI